MRATFITDFIGITVVQGMLMNLRHQTTLNMSYSRHSPQSVVYTHWKAPRTDIDLDSVSGLGGNLAERFRRNLALCWPRIPCSLTTGRLSSSTYRERVDNISSLPRSANHSLHCHRMDLTPTTQTRTQLANYESPCERVCG